MKRVIGKAYMLLMLMLIMGCGAGGLLFAASSWRVGYYAVTKETSRAASDGLWFKDMLFSLELVRENITPAGQSWHSLLTELSLNRQHAAAPGKTDAKEYIPAEMTALPIEFVELPASAILTPLFLEGGQEFLDVVMRRAGLDGLLVVQSHGEEFISRLTVYYVEVQKIVIQGQGEDTAEPVAGVGTYTTVYDTSFPSYARAANRDAVFRPVVTALSGLDRSFLTLLGLPAEGGTLVVDGQVATEIFENTFAIVPGIHDIQVDALGFEPYVGSVTVFPDAAVPFQISMVPRYAGAAVISSLTGDVHWVLNGKAQPTSLPVFLPEINVPLSLAVYKDGFFPFFWQTTQPQPYLAVDLRPAWMTQDIVEIRQRGYYQSMARLLASIGTYIGVGVIKDMMTPANGLVPPVWRLVDTVATGAVVLTLVDFIGELLLYGNSVQPEMIF
ncbi:hypothetical protein [Parasphaerochaeta coccoides]|uniref:PEGA domain-containing protein n=1 Tax=Parasphaerochaeta coccoides (strain ATCC BAA-1237 / DSM 17374 / SPN1) TaxID=760011 RepID=F4GJC6_PARC1|nr:hypothetical protein [Parasphaerochaeta coccoides]AEC01766.1 hypothetical protein Spico_0538 [Parasphaerochaeta coccoides DSM 17374]